MAYGRGGRIGLINPTAVYDVLAKELEKVMPPDVLVLVRSLSIRNLLPEEFAKARSLYREAALDLADCEADVIIAAGNPVMTQDGVDGDARLAAELGEAVGIPVTTLLAAEREAVHAHGAQRIVLVSPFTVELNRARARYFARHGVEVLADEGAGITHNVEITKLSPEVPYAMARRLLDRHPEAQAALITCPRWPVVEIVERLERETGRPVVSAVHALARTGLNLLGARGRAPQRRSA